ncbi:Mal regulon transcriptional regulator MalI [Mixta sp. Marseille-Q2659]|uniref:Mal regulon transcriptional regulator MalI n=1 Tax=Mixta sp. Marseille-Q2659 TaxID=2736607 RepID=UPI0023B98AED|nr:Mal regulon transcriptional regulator MalI [Mixta sp. Marseille-Q2659]
MSQKKITIHDVAEQAGVSVTTVSLVLSGKGRISAVTARRVSEAIDTLGYVRNRSAVSLRGGESGVIGLIVRDICHPFYAEMTAGLSETLEAQGKILVLTQSGNTGQNLQRCFESLLAQGVDGIVLGGGAENATGLPSQAREAGIALVCAARASSLDEVDSIRPDNMQAARMATEFLIKQGHHRIAWVGGSGGSLTRAERIGGYCATLLQYGLPFRHEWIIEGEPQHIAARTEALLHAAPSITAIVCHNMTVALSCYFGALGTGRTLGQGAVESWYGQQVALVGFGDASQLQMSELPLTRVSIPARETGRQAALRLLHRLSQPESDTQNIILPAALVAHQP